MSRHWIWIPVATVVSLSAASAQDVYRWTDESGRVHFSNVGPTGEGSERREMPTESRAAPEAPAPSAGKTEEGYAGLTEDDFSNTASRKRGQLQQRLRSAKSELRRIESEMASIRGIRDQSFAEVGSQLQGVGRPEYVDSDEEKQLTERKEEIEEEIAAIRKEYDDLRESAVERHGSLPGWWRPLD